MSFSFVSEAIFFFSFSEWIKIQNTNCDCGASYCLIYDLKLLDRNNYFKDIKREKKKNLRRLSRGIFVNFIMIWWKFGKC